MVQGLALQPIIKLTDACNLRCRYCYQEALGPRKGSMEPALLTRILQELAGAVRRPVSILWYGGEPTLIGRQRFAECLEQAETIIGPGQVRHSLQTNGVGLDSSWAALLGRHSVAVTLSLDGPEPLHDQQRPTTGGKGSHGAVVSSLQALLEEGLKPRVSCVLTEGSLALKDGASMLGYFWDLGVRELDFPPALRLVGGRLESWLDPRAYGQFLSEVFQAWLELGLKELRIRSLAGMVRRLAGKPGNTCKLEGDCSAYVTIGCDGRVFACDEFSSLPGHCLGDLKEQSLAEVLASPARRNLLGRWASSTQACSDCRWVSACPGSCPFERQAAGGLEHVSYLCESWKTVFPVMARALGRDC